MRDFSIEPLRCNPERSSTLKLWCSQGQVERRQKEQGCRKDNTIEGYMRYDVQNKNTKQLLVWIWQYVAEARSRVVRGCLHRVTKCGRAANPRNFQHSYCINGSITQRSIYVTNDWEVVLGWRTGHSWRMLPEAMNWCGTIIAPYCEVPSQARNITSLGHLGPINSKPAEYRGSMGVQAINVMILSACHQ